MRFEITKDGIDINFEENDQKMYEEILRTYILENKLDHLLFMLYKDLNFYVISKDMDISSTRLNYLNKELYNFKTYNNFEFKTYNFLCFKSIEDVEYKDTNFNLNEYKIDINTKILNIENLLNIKQLKILETEKNNINYKTNNTKSRSCLNEELESINYKNKELEKYVSELKKKNIIMSKKLKRSIPFHIITYLIFCSIVIGSSVTLILLKYIYHVHIVEVYYVISTLIIALTLFATALTAIKDWRKFLNER